MNVTLIAVSALDMATRSDRLKKTPDRISLRSKPLVTGQTLSLIEQSEWPK